MVLAGLQFGNATKICMECVERLRIAYNFRETVLLTQKTAHENCTRSVKNCLQKDVVSEGTSSEGQEEMLIKEEILELSCDNDNDGTDYNSSDVLAKLCTDLEIDVQDNIKKNIIRLTNDSEEDRPNKCEFCELKLGSKRLLKEHINEFHKKDNSYVCIHCKKQFKKLFHLKEHIAGHTGEKLYSCDLCGKSFQRLSSRSRHMKAHERAPGQKSRRTPFLCTICGVRFPFSNSVQRHMRMHMGIKLHECEICHKRFNQKTHLRVHMRTHTGEKPYICELCGNAFSLNATLQKHMNIHIQRKDIKVESSKMNFNFV